MKTNDYPLIFVTQLTCIICLCLCYLRLHNVNKSLNVRFHRAKLNFSLKAINQKYISFNLIIKELFSQHLKHFNKIVFAVALYALNRKLLGLKNKCQFCGCFVGMCYFDSPVND